MPGAQGKSLGFAFTVFKGGKSILKTKNLHIAFQDVFIVSGDDTDEEYKTFGWGRREVAI